MAKAIHFSELECWQEARKLVAMIYSLLDDTNQMHRDFVISNQIRRASISVMNNIAEGFGRYSDNEFIRFLDIAKASCFEVESLSYILEDINAITPARVNELKSQIEITPAKTSGLLKYLVNKRNAKP